MQLNSATMEVLGTQGHQECGAPHVATKNELTQTGERMPLRPPYTLDAGCRTP